MTIHIVNSDLKGKRLANADIRYISDRKSQNNPIVLPVIIAEQAPKANIIGFQYWTIGSKMQISAISTGATLKIKKDAFLEYKKEGNSVASWFEGTVKDAKKQFSCYPEVLYFLVPEVINNL